MTALDVPTVTLTKQDIQALAAQAAAGDLRAFDVIHTRYEAAITRHVSDFVGYGEDAFDLTQQVFLKAWLALITNKYDPRGAFGGWLYRIATNVCKDELRHRALVDFHSLETMLSNPMTTRQAALLVSHDPLDDPAWVAERRDAAQEAQERVRTLLPAIETPLQRQALCLREYADLSYDEIAVALDTSRAAVKSLLHRSRNAIRAAVAQERSYAS